MLAMFLDFVVLDCILLTVYSTYCLKLTFMFKNWLYKLDCIMRLYTLKCSFEKCAYVFIVIYWIYISPSLDFGRSQNSCSSIISYCWTLRVEIASETKVTVNLFKD